MSPLPHKALSMNEIQQIKQLIEETLNKMGISYTSVSVVDTELPDYTKFDIETQESGMLIGKDGEHLSALSFVLRKMLEKQFDTQETPRFYIDIGGYQKTKIEKIQKVAKIMAERATSFKRDIELPPMTAYERMVIHSTLKEMPNIETESQGKGRDRRIYVRFKEETPII